MIITISGKAEHGKDLTAALLKEELKKENKKVLIIHYADLLKFIAKKYFGWNGKKDEEGRSLLQWLGTDKVRKTSPNYWVDFVKSIATLFKDDFDYFIMPDTRFPNEIYCWKQDNYDWDSVALHVERLDHTNKLTEEQQNHPSETALDNYKFDYYIKTNTGVPELIVEIKKFINWTQGEKA